MLRKAKSTEIEKVMSVIEDGVKFLKQQGINQWQHGSPGRSDVENDIKQEASYVYELDGEIVATAMLNTYDADYEKYPTIWTKCSNYLVIHRLAIKKEYRSQGVGHKFMNDIILFAKENSVEYIRIDTHKDNVIMRKYLSKNSFKELGKIKLSMKNSLDDKERIAYELKIE
ncbi:GNAT family N-acetyltransferase [Gemella sanguinis]|uniref:GNAT family N-acetyltransferase n=1 Tax=Gemella sanguinis TaxID=84135 RepID=UPI0028D43534|nr:GNAT family N-acetyltransferase [Gemella sanguinis]